MDFFADTPIQIRKKPRICTSILPLLQKNVLLYGSNCHGDPTINIARTVPILDFNLFKV
jgi:hypothetical protein